MRLHLLILLLLSTPLALADGRSRIEPEVLIPLAKGNVWQYRVAGTGEAQRAAVTGSQQVDGVNWYRYQELGDTFWLRNEGVVQLEALDAFDQEAPGVELFSGTPIFLHPSLAQPRYQTEFGAIEYTPCAEPLTVPAGTFACHAYRVEMSESAYSISHFALGVGLIRSELYSNGQRRITELQRYDVK